MKIKLDQNLSQHLRGVWAEFGHDVDTVFDEGLSGASDADVLAAATSRDRLLFTLDTDFLDLKTYPPSSHSGVVVFRPPRQGALALMRFVKAFVRSTDLRRLHGGTTVVERRRVRVFR